MKILVVMLAVVTFARGVSAAVDTASIVGDWAEPAGSVIRIAPCAQNYCAQIVQLSKDAPGTMDENNPDTSLRSRPLCGLVIGTGFHMTDSEHADGGSLYDPKTGHTYRGTISRDGDSLNLRGYVGFKMFGRSETWHRTRLAGQACRA